MPGMAEDRGPMAQLATPALHVVPETVAGTLAGHEARDAKVTARDVSVFYGDKQALFDVFDRHSRSRHDGVHRTVGLR